MKNILFKIIMNFDGKGYVKCKYVPTLNKIYFTLFYKQFNRHVSAITTFSPFHNNSYDKKNVKLRLKRVSQKYLR
jgi:hypothetical protein